MEGGGWQSELPFLCSALFRSLGTLTSPYAFDLLHIKRLILLWLPPPKLHQGYDPEKKTYLTATIVNSQENCCTQTVLINQPLDAVSETTFIQVFNTKNSTKIYIIRHFMQCIHSLYLQVQINNRRQKQVFC